MGCVMSTCTFKNVSGEQVVPKIPKDRDLSEFDFDLNGLNKD